MEQITWFVVNYIIFDIWLCCYGHCSVPLHDFYDAGNTNCLRNNDWYSWIELNYEFDFFGDKYERILISYGGFIVFGEPNYFDFLNSFPGPGTYLAPFWTYYLYWDEMVNACWKEVTSGQELERAGEEVSAYFPELINFNVSWMLIGSWIDIPTAYSHHESQPPLRNTFQAVLVTDGLLSFVIYNYNKIQYTKFPYPPEPNPSHSKVGFNKGDDTHYYAVEGSGTQDIATIVSRSNVNRTGKFVFRLNGYMVRPVKVADIVFVIDSSYSEETLFDIILQYIVDVTDNLTIATNNTQVAVLSFSITANVEFDFLFCQDKDRIHERVLNISHLNRTSYMETGLEKARDMFLWTKGGRQSALKFVVVVSDGLVNDREKAIRSARDLSGGGIKVISVGLGKSVYHTVLEKVAFNSSYLLSPDPSKLLDRLQWELHDQNSTGCETKHSADMLLLVESSASQSDKMFEKVLDFLQSFLIKISSHHSNNNVTISVATYGTNTKYVVKESHLSNLQYMMDAIKELRQSPDDKTDWESVMTFAETHTSYSSVETKKYVLFVTTALITEQEHVRTQLGHLRDKNKVNVVMIGVADHADWTVLENVYDYGFFTFSTDDVDVMSRVLWNDIEHINCTTFGKT